MAGSRAVYAGSRIFQSLSNFVGLPIDQLNFIISQSVMLLLAVLYRKVLRHQNVSVETRHIFILSFGIALGYFCFGHQISHLCVQGTLAYIVMNNVNPKLLHRRVLFISMLYLSSLHLLRLQYEFGAWTLDITGPVMIATQKVTSVAFSLHDGLTRPEVKLTAHQRKHIIKRIPTMLEFFSYIFHFQTLLCGPLVFYNDYIDFIKGTNPQVSKNPEEVYIESPPPKQVVRKLAISICFGLFLIFVVPFFPIRYLKDPVYLYETPWYRQLLYIIICTSFARSKYYHAWLLGESVANASGLGFNGFTTDGKPKWDLVSNIDILNFELSSNVRETVKTWNISTQQWLKIIVYDRAPSHKTLLTYLLSALWHGFYPGYYFTFLGGALFTMAARSVRRSIRPYFQLSCHTAFVYDIITCITTRVCLAYIVFPFLLVEFYASIQIYWQFYFIGHILSIFAIFLLPKVLPPPEGLSKSTREDMDKLIPTASEINRFFKSRKASN
ncbi:lysophospholipid acyltransferase 6-like isoform X2 [Tachypleus tridentatus]|uniref:lysophospholipid acyltransferase 6-like isoform X2 n=1 Tax=Tachypleus tridentatus TaxID=6853 RepID=UPI003FD60B87